MMHPPTVFFNINPLLAFLFLSLLAFLPSTVFAKSQKFTIDDTNGDAVNGFKPSYHPQHLWEPSSCAGCGPQPESEKAFNQTFSNVLLSHSSDNVSIDIPFSGNGIDVYFIVRDSDGVATETKCNFTIDDLPAGSFESHTNGERNYSYDTLAFSKTDLSNTNHTLKIFSEGQDRSVYINFDRAEYTIDDGQSESESSSSAAAASSTATASSSPVVAAAGVKLEGATLRSVIIGSVIGGVVLLALLALLIFFLCRRRRQQQVNSDMPSSPMIEHHDPVIEKEFSLTKDLSKDSSSIYSETGYLPELPIIRPPKFPGGYAPHGVSIPAQAHVRKASEVSTSSPITPPSGGTIARFSSISSYGILQRTGTRLTQGLMKHVSASRKNPSPTPDDMRMQVRKAKLRQFERDQWRLRMDIRDVENEIKQTTDEGELERLRTKVDRLQEEMDMVTVQQESLQEAPLSPETPHAASYV